MLSNIDDILDVAIKHIYNLYPKSNPEEKLVQLQDISAEDVIIERFSLPNNSNSKALARPVYWHFMQHYAQTLPQEKIGNEYVNFVKLKKPLPYWEDFKKEILSQEWVKPYLESNLEQLYL